LKKSFNAAESNFCGVFFIGQKLWQLQDKTAPRIEQREAVAPAQLTVRELRNATGQERFAPY